MKYKPEKSNTNETTFYFVVSVWRLFVMSFWQKAVLFSSRVYGASYGHLGTRLNVKGFCRWLGQGAIHRMCFLTTSRSGHAKQKTNADQKILATYQRAKPKGKKPKMSKLKFISCHRGSVSILIHSQQYLLAHHFLCVCRALVERLFFCCSFATNIVHINLTNKLTGIQHVRCHLSKC